jgi:hypothetical protein
VALDVAGQVVDQPIRLLPADPFFFGIAITDVSEFGAIE